MSDEPRWTSEPPTAEGFYWWRSGPEDDKGQVVQVSKSPLSEKLFVHRIGTGDFDYTTDFEGQFWSARIEEPSSARQLAIP